MKDELDIALDNEFSHFSPEPGKKCMYKNCIGIIYAAKPPGSCSCHTGHPPCSWCTTSILYCPVCCWEETYYC